MPHLEVFKSIWMALGKYGLVVNMVVLWKWLDMKIIEVFQPEWFYDSVFI